MPTSSNNPVIDFPQDSTLRELNAILKDNADRQARQFDEEIVAALDGTQATYNRLMRKWFRANGANGATPAELTALCDKWYTITREPWHGWVKFYRSGVSAVSNAKERGGDNAGLSCTPSTDTVAGQDDYAGLPLFACVDCNWIVDGETLEPQITAIDGITDNFRRYSPEHYVGVIQMSGYFYEIKTDSEIVDGYSSLRNINAEGIEPLDEAIRVDGTVRPWVVHRKYFSHTVGGKMTSYAGVIPTAWQSHNTVHTLAKATGSQYSGGTTADDAFLKIMARIKYASLTLDGILQGCCNNNYQYPVALGESGVRRVLLTEEQAANFAVGMGVLIGNYAGNVDRAQAAMYSITGQAGAIITAIESVSISDTNYKAVYVDTAEPFDTTANGAATNGTTYISTFHWKNGATDGVLGNDGSPVSNTSGKYPAKLQGIEYMQGAYEVFADVILSLYKDADGVYWYEPYICRKSAKQATSITSDYEASGIKCKQPAATGWQYIVELAISKGVFFPVNTVGGSSSTYTRDAFYENAASEGTREWLARCGLGAGVAHAGLSALYGRNALSDATWDIVGGLSPNGNRGEWAA